MFERIDVSSDGSGCAVRLLEDLFLHEMAIIALFHGGAGGLDQRLRARHFDTGFVVNRVRIMVQHAPVAFLEINHAVCEWRYSKRIRAKKHLIIANPDHQGRSFASADQQVIMALEQNAERKGPFKIGQRRFNRCNRVRSCLQVG